jgi:hypothetical protein
VPQIGTSESEEMSRIVQARYGLYVVKTLLKRPEAMGRLVDFPLKPIWAEKLILWTLFCYGTLWLYG